MDTTTTTTTTTEFATKVLTDGEIHDMLDREVTASADHTSAYWYAWGRLDQGHPPIANSPVYSSAGTPDTTTTAWWFAFLYHEHKNSNLGGTCGLPSAWQNFVASKGNQVGWIR